MLKDFNQPLFGEAAFKDQYAVSFLVFVYWCH